MTAEYVWSPSSAGFYPLIEKERLKAAGGWPEDGVDVSSEEYAALFPAPSGKYIGNVDGRPGWVDIPPPTAEQREEAARSKQVSLRAKADSEITWRQDAVDIGEATEKETADLNLWKKYRVLLMRVETSNPLWPPTPDG
ncbi:tail fiber assembly protein [Enterobacter asburiae]|uniref:Tail fiber assembly protein n=1 Tax=Enterobacter asburiae TaxID=61645 RepID=A0AAW7ZRC2_ENTAS|nr:tail fiber assembly protein [Enterobacter asburiae]MCL8161945.1 tail fiber assembly protein [Enterobacter asburiae]MCM7943750.1 tail fiber assembly protein [Enterobacter asburiae]MDO7924256.1 tail fiber assembly protein [Enterobacter asburiae]MDV0916017.1 tail fiber assembly protein [Enterobacter asburiae]MDV0935996.1 tail fiber assembly protein [Enterobacter asburiae]